MKLHHWTGYKSEAGIASPTQKELGVLLLEHVLIKLNTELRVNTYEP